VLITIVCPRCKSQYSVGDVLLGKVIRCPNDHCRISFSVGGDESPEGGNGTPGDTPSNKPRGSPPGSGPGKQWSGSVDDMLTMLSAEAVEPPGPDSQNGSKHVADFLPVADAEIEPTSRPPNEKPWDQPPPVRKPPAGPAPPVAPEPSRRKPARRQQHATPPPAAAPPQAPLPTAPAPPVAPPQPLQDDLHQPPPTLPEKVGEVGAPPVEPTVTSWEAAAPPVRRGADGSEAEQAGDSAAALSVEDATLSTTRRRKRRNLWIIAGTVAGVFVVVSCTVWLAIALVGKSESARADGAYEEFKHKQFANAAEDFRDIQKRYGVSKRLDEYRAMADLGNVLAAATTATNSVEEAVQALDEMGSFANSHKSDLVVKEHAEAIGQAAARLVEVVTDAEKANPSEGTPDRLNKVESVVKQVADLGSSVFEAGVRDKLDQQLTEARTVHGLWARRHAAREKVLGLLDNRGLTPVDAFKSVRELLRRYEREFPGFRDDAAIKSAIDRLDKRHLASVVFKEAKDAAAAPETKRPPAAEIPYPGILFDPRTDEIPAGPAVTPPPDERVVLSLVRGVLHAHSLTNGRVLWAVRVGVDTTTLPVRVPAATAIPERILVLLADSETLVALNPQGNEVWRYHLGSACLGRPVVIDSTVYLSTNDGHVHEVELSGGRLIGTWNLGQPLSCGGAREGTSKIVYFPADDSFIYVLNVDPQERRCVAILYSQHAAGSLRGEPIVIAPATRSIHDEQTTLPGYLILNLTDGLDRTKLAVFPLPLTDRNGPPSSDRTVPHPGWTWDTPFHDPEKIALVTDAAFLAVYGIRQAGNRDPDIFQQVGLNLDALLKPEGSARGRGQIAAMHGDDLWVLSNGKLQRFEKVSSVSTGPRLNPAWPAALEVGSPLHPTREVEDPSTGQKALVVVTQALKQQVCMVTSVRTEDREKQWQRRLGLICQGAPVLLGDPLPPAADPTPPTDPQVGAGAPAAPPLPPVLLTLGQSAEVFALDPVPIGRQKSQWISAARSLVAGPLDDNPATLPILLAANDRLSAYEVAFPGTGNLMVVRRFTLNPATRQTKMDDQQEIKLPAASSSAGAPVVVGNWLVVPLTNGVVYTVSLSPIGATRKEGSNWRSSRLGSDARCYITALGPDKFVATDGARGLTFWEISETGLMSGLFRDKERPGIDLDDRVAAAPILLAGPEGATRLLIADASGLLRTIEISQNSAQELPQLRWDLGGRVTAGPFLRTLPGSKPRVGCVLDGRRLVWIDPLKAKELLWTYGPTRGSIVGEPQVVDGRIVVADQAGGIVALDPLTGKPQGKGYTLPGSVAPTAPPVALDRDQLFTPLTDGTVLLVPLGLFR
jgi:hypothetical protein